MWYLIVSFPDLCNLLTFNLSSGLHTLLNVNIRTINYVYSPDAVLQKLDVFYMYQKLNRKQMPISLTIALSYASY